MKKLDSRNKRAQAEFDANKRWMDSGSTSSTTTATSAAAAAADTTPATTYSSFL